MQFWINIKAGSKNVRLLVVQVGLNREWEIYEIKGRDRKITVQSNRPFLRNVKNLKNVPPEWKVIDGQVKYKSYFDAAIVEIMKVVDK